MAIFSEYSSNNKRLIGIISILGILFLFSFTGVPILEKILGIDQINSTLFLISRLFYWFLLALVFFYVTKIEHQKMLLWQEKQLTAVNYFASVIIIYLVLLVSLVITRFLLTLAHFENAGTYFLELLPLFKNSRFLLVFTCVTAGVVEELIFRGYLLPRIAVMSNSNHLAVWVSSLFFGLMHFKYGTVYNVVGPFVIGMVFGYYYLKFRNIKTIIFCHIMWDLFALLALTHFTK